jgi:hypothetical protein
MPTSTLQLAATTLACAIVDLMWREMLSLATAFFTIDRVQIYAGLSVFWSLLSKPNS